MNEFLNILLTNILPPIATAFATWFFVRRKSTAEAESDELGNVEKAIGIYRQIATDLKVEMLELREQMVTLERQNRELMKKLELENLEKAEWRQKFLRLEVKMNELIQSSTNQ